MKIDSYISDPNGTSWSEKYQSGMADFMQVIAEMKEAVKVYRDSGRANIEIALEREKTIERLEQIQKGYALCMIQRNDLINLINTKEWKLTSILTEKRVPLKIVFIVANVIMIGNLMLHQFFQIKITKMG